jgi:predicted amidophosphoribosyltransferase
MTAGVVGGPGRVMLSVGERVVPLVVECPNCHAPVPVSDTLCFRCGSELPNEAYDSLR